MVLVATINIQPSSGSTVLTTTREVPVITTLWPSREYVSTRRKRWRQSPHSELRRNIYHVSYPVFIFAIFRPLTLKGLGTLLCSQTSTRSLLSIGFTINLATQRDCGVVRFLRGHRERNIHISTPTDHNQEIRSVHRYAPIT
jgi:hypothetical protein